MSAEDEEFEGIVPAKSAYQYFMKLNSTQIKESLLKEGKEVSMGALTSAVASKWKAVNDSEREKYEEMARKDKLRHQEECRRRDEEFLREQEKRRNANQVGEVQDSRMRNSTLSLTDATKAKFEVPKKERRVSEHQKEKFDARRQARKEEDAAVKGQFDTIKRERIEQAEARLKYLLSQSDIFSHFGEVQVDVKKPKEVAPTGVGRGRKSSSRAAAAASDELDDDEKAMLDEEDDEEEGSSSGSSSSSSKAGKDKTTVLRTQPSCITGGAMRPYQLEGLNWMVRLQENGINGILADEMGLGKTLQSISILGFMKEYRDCNGPHLVMVPKSTLSNWCNEFKRWCPSLRVLRFHGSKEERLEIVENMLKPAQVREQRQWDVVVTTYEVVNMERAALTRIAWNYLVIDEAHRLKNEASQFSQTVRQLVTKYRLLLTGTPLQNNLHELWALLNFLLPDVFASAEQFDEWFNLDVDDQEAKQRMISQLHKLLRPFMLRRLKADVEKSLPPKSETILFTGMSAMQKNLYRQVLLRDIDTINSNSANSNNSNGSRTAILNIVMQLRKCCNHPYLFQGLEDRTLDPMGEHLYQNCGKMVLLHKLLWKMKERGHRVLIFSQMTRMIDILEDYMLSQQFTYCRIDGNTSYEDREDRIFEFNKPDSDIFCFVLSTRAGGLGINLQTADTVILYDSDWNPQADLQAQDRAHRIGQKRPVQVFRLVTDDTVEVKVVERAQQKLKLDAMVVQQGRLQEKEKKMSKQDLLDTLRFGADKIFRSKDSTISDADIDLILEEGRQRTTAMTESLVDADKGDMYDFKLDGGMGAQMFEGKDYGDKAMRQQELNALNGLAFIDPGKRERKAIASYAETISRREFEETEKRQKLPRHLRLAKMEDWQFYNKQRLTELQSEEVRLFEAMVDRGEAPAPNTVSKLVVLPEELQEEKTLLVKAAFGDWTRVHYNNFIRASSKHGRAAFEKIAKEVGKTVEETQRYAQVFWERGPTDLTTQEWEKILRQIEKGERRLEEISRLTTATAKLINMFDDPWEELTFRNVGNQGRVFNAVEDRYLLCLTHLHGYGNWDQVRNSVRRCERFRFDFYLQSCSADMLGKRCEHLMRSAEKELAELERRRQPTDSSSGGGQAVDGSAAAGDAGGGAGVAASMLTASDQVRERMSQLTKQIADGAKKLAATRNQLQKLRGSSGDGLSALKNITEGASSDMIVKAFAKAAASSNSSGGGAERQRKTFGGTGQGAVPQTVPEILYPELCKLIHAGGPDGIGKIITTFAEAHPEVSKRQTELKVNELGVKEKDADESQKTWKVRPEFQRYLRMSAEEIAQLSKFDPTGGTGGVNGSSSGGGKKKDPSSAAAGGGGKRKRSDSDHDGSGAKKSLKSAAGGSSIAVPPPGEGPRKYKRALGHFVKAHRAQAEKEIGPDKQDELRDLLTKMWAEATAEERKLYEKKEAEDRERYERELAEYWAQKDAEDGAAAGVKRKSM